MKKVVLLWTIFFISMFLSGCGGMRDDPNRLDIMLFTDLPMDLNDNIASFFESVDNHEELTTEVHMFLSSPEKLMVEMVGGDGDIYIVEDSMFNIIFDPVILQPLDSIVDLDSVDGMLGRFIDINEDTGEEHLYAIPLDNDSPFLQGIGIEMSSSLIAVMMKDRVINNAGLELLKEMYH